MKTLYVLVLMLFSSSIYSQTCTSSGGDDIPDIDDYPYHFRCGTSRMHGMKKASSDYKLIKACNNYWAEGNYYKKGNQIYYSPEYGEFELVKGADVKSFRCEGGSAMDNNSVFYLGKTVSNINKNSFISVAKVYCKDNNRVYYKDKYADSGKLTEMNNAQASSFQSIGDSLSYYAKDDSAVYFYGKRLEGSDPESFEILAYGYSRDNNYAYYNEKKIEGMKGETFEVLKDSYLGSDGALLCNGGVVIENSDASSFKAIECGYYKDKNNVYLNGRTLDGVDSETFQILSWGYTKDKNAVYCDLKLIEGANPKTFEVLARKHSKDDKSIFYLDQKMDCDYTSFKVSYELDYLSSDKNHKYSKGLRQD